MPFTITKLNPQEADARVFIATERLGFTADRSRVVPYDDVDAAFLFCFPGQSIPMADAVKYGLVAVAQPEHEIETNDEPEVKDLQPAETKVKQPREKKSKQPQLNGTAD